MDTDPLWLIWVVHFQPATQRSFFQVNFETKTQMILFFYKCELSSECSTAWDYPSPLIILVLLDVLTRAFRDCKQLAFLLLGGYSVRGFKWSRRETSVTSLSEQNTSATSFECLLWGSRWRSKVRVAWWGGEWVGFEGSSWINTWRWNLILLILRFRREIKIPSFLSQHSSTERTQIFRFSFFSESLFNHLS